MMFNIFELAKVLTNRNFRKIRIYYYFSKIGREVCGNEWVLREKDEGYVKTNEPLVGTIYGSLKWSTVRENDIVCVCENDWVVCGDDPKVAKTIDCSTKAIEGSIKAIECSLNTIDGIWKQLRGPSERMGAPWERSRVRENDEGSVKTIDGSVGTIKG